MLRELGGYCVRRFLNFGEFHLFAVTDDFRNVEQDDQLIVGLDDSHQVLLVLISKGRSDRMFSCTILLFPSIFYIRRDRTSEE